MCTCLSVCSATDYIIDQYLRRFSGPRKGYNPEHEGFALLWRRYGCVWEERDDFAKRCQKFAERGAVRQYWSSILISANVISGMRTWISSLRRQLRGLSSSLFV